MGEVELLPMDRDVQVISFQIAKETYALDILEVQEILKYREVIRVPLTPPWIEGVLNLRGQILPVINFRIRVGLQRQDPDRHSRFIFVRHQLHQVCLLVDSVAEVLQIKETSLVSILSTTVDKTYIRHVSKQEKGLVIMLDLNRILFEHEDQLQVQEAV